MPHDLGWGLSGELLDRHPRWVPGATTSGQHAFEPCARCSGTQLPAGGGGGLRVAASLPGSTSNDIAALPLSESPCWPLCPAWPLTCIVP